MSRGRKIAAIVGGALAGLILIVIISGIVIVQTDWFRNMVRTKLISAVEEATGGTVEVGSFAFDWHHLRAQVRNFVIHGTEPAGSAPLLRANLLQVDLKLTSPFKRFVDIAYLLVDTPQANVIVYPDGHTNIPNPKVQPKSSNKTGVETIVDLAIGHFDLRNGSFSFAERKSALNANGENFRMQVGYNALTPSYTGQLDIAPLHARLADNAPVDINVKMPITMERDKITLTAAEITTPQSKIVVSGAMDHLIAPRTNAHLNAQIALEEVRRIAGVTAIDTAHGPKFADADVTAYMDDNRIQVKSARVTLGHSSVEASGTLKDVNQPGAVQFNADLALGELGRMMHVAARPDGEMKIGGNATLQANNDYLVTANVEGRGVAFHSGSTRVSGISLASAVKADPHRIELSGLRLSALGGTFAGNAAVQDMAGFKLAGSLQRFDLATVAHAFMSKPLGYDGVISGPVQADGNIKNMSTLVAKASLGIAPGPHGIPVSGHLGVDYNASSDNVALDRSYLVLPHSRIDLSGSLGKQIQVRLVSHNLSDFAPVAANIPVTFTNNGAATLNATVSGSLAAPRVAGQLAVNNFAVDGRPFTNLTAGINAASSGAAVANAVLARGPLEARFSGSVGLHNWTPLKSDPVKVDATVRNADMRDILALAGQASIDMTGALTADAHINGTVGDPRGSADLAVNNGTVEGERFDSLTAHANLNQTSIDVPDLHWIAGPSRIDAIARYQHPPDDLQRGTVTAHVGSNQVQLAQFQALVKDRPGLRGVANITADLSANIQPGPKDTNFNIVNLNANASIRNLEMEGKRLGDLTATANTAGNAVRYNVNSDFAGSTIHVNGQSLLTGDHETTATAAIANLPIDRVLAVAGQTDLPVRGTLGLNGQVSGTLKDPRAMVTVSVTNGVAYDEPFNRLQATVNYDSTLIDVPNFRVDDGPSWVELTASFRHPANDLKDGDVRFRVRSNDIQLTRIHNLQQAKPGLAGIVQLTADGAATLHKSAPIHFASLNANVAARAVSMNKLALGDLTATATTSGNAVNFNLASDLGHADIRGTGRMDLAGDHPVTAQITFNNVTYSGLAPLFNNAQPQPFDASLQGSLNVSGPLDKTEDLRGTLQLTKLEAHSVAPGKGRKPRVDFQLRNDGNILVALDRSVVTIQNFRVVGPYTNLAVTGTASLHNPEALNLRANGNVRLDVLEAFNTDIFSSGAITLNAAVTGTPSQPNVNGTLQLQNASFNILTAPQGISNANGTITFNGTEAFVQNLTGESGGGKITLAGYVNYGGPEMNFRLQATAARVHVEAPDTVTTQIGAQITIAGTTSSSLISGNVVIQDVAMHSHSDVGSILSSAATPPPVATASTGILGGMHFDVRIRTAPDVQFRTTLTQNLQADANLTLRGTLDHPGMIGRVVVTQGDIVFFGAKYSIDQGNVAFYDPAKIDPILNIDLSTTVQGIDVSVSVSGPLDRMKLAYRSDPPLQFQQIVSLLASGKVPTTDPVLAAHSAPAPEQNLEQAGVSTLLGQAVANPISGRLQRLFGVSKLSIDPQIVGTSNTPQATLTFQQQVTKQITFTYIQDVTKSNSEAIRVEWAISPTFSAIAQRDIYGMFDLDFFYKKRFH